MKPWETPCPAGAERIAAQHAALPVIETDRLVLRPPRIEDWQALAPIWTEPRGWNADDLPDAEAAWLDFNQLVASWLLRGYGPLTITAPDGRVLGLVSINHEFGDPEPELGWFLIAGAEGQGYATEAARAVQPWLAELFGPGGYVSYVDPGNARSNAVAARLAARRDPLAEAAITEPVHVWRHPIPNSAATDPKGQP